mgnify:CR=1 FL=1
MNKLLIGILIGLALIAGLLINLTQKGPPKLGDAGSGLPAQLASTSVVSVGPSNNGVLLFPKSNFCSSRVISTKERALLLMFDNVATQASSTLNSRFGHLQAASTTVNYDSGVYGCGTVYAFGFDATTSITTSEY